MDALRAELVNLLRGGQAYDPFQSVVAGFKPAEHGLVPPGAERSPWQIVDHVRLAQRDILDYIQNENGTYRHKACPDEYWAKDAEPEPGAWERAVKGIQDGNAEFVRLLDDPGRDLYAQFPWGDGQNLLREVLVASDHLAYHTGQLVELKRWIDSKK